MSTLDEKIELLRSNGFMLKTLEEFQRDVNTPIFVQAVERGVKIVNEFGDTKVKHVIWDPAKPLGFRLARNDVELETFIDKFNSEAINAADSESESAFSPR